MNFINLPVAFRGRRLIQVPSGIINNRKLNTGYDPNLDATMAELPYKGGKFSLILILPGKQTEFIAGGLSRIESRLNATLWNGLLRRMSPHKIDFKMPLFRHRSVINHLKDAFIEQNMTSAFSSDDADFSGVNGGRDLWMSEIVQLNEVKIESGGQPTRQPDTPEVNSNYRSAGRFRNHRQARQFVQMGRKDFARQDHTNHDPQSHHEHHEQHPGQEHNEHHHPHDHHSESTSNDEDSSTVRIFFERQFMYAIRHNPTGMLVYIGRYYQPEEATNHHHDPSHSQHH
jgi:hypothetical protein